MNQDNNGIEVKFHDKEIIIKGNQSDLLELSNYIKKIADEKGNNHIHLDELTLLSTNSNIKELIIEKEEENEYES